MIMLDLNEKQAKDLQMLIQSAGGEAEIVEEKRFFGDAGTVSIIFEGSKSLIELVSVSLSAWCAYQQIKGSKNGDPIFLENDLPNEVSDKLE
jgi:hypothetical protein